MKTKQLVATLVSKYPNLREDKVPRGKAFGVIINTKNADGETLQAKFGEKKAIKLTVKTLEGLGYSGRQTPVTVDF